MPTDLTLTTCPEAAARYHQGVDCFRAGDPVAAASAFRAAIDHDPGFALGYAGLAITEPDGQPLAVIARARQTARRISRRERQHVAIVELVLQGRMPRASALGREHLTEFPDDALVLHVLAQHCDDLDDLIR